MPLWRGGPNTRTLPTVLLTPSASKAADMAHLCVPQNQALGVCRGFAPDIQICGTHGRKNLVNATIISNAEEEENAIVLPLIYIFSTDLDLSNRRQHTSYTSRVKTRGLPSISSSDQLDQMGACKPDLKEFTWMMSYLTIGQTAQSQREIRWKRRTCNSQQL